ncbi:MAG: hypothetical protein AB7R55_03810 [Gemmatimonadales bacterium]
MRRARPGGWPRATGCSGRGSRASEIGRGDPLTFALAAVGFVVVAWVGSYLPARRASTVDPLIALRSD